LRQYEADAELMSAMGEGFSQAYLKLKHQEWNAFTSHFSEWERENTLDI
jgi:glutamine synthetase